MSFVTGMLASMSVMWIFACKYDNITIGIVANGTGVIESETISSHDQYFVIVKNLVDTSEMFEIFTAVQIFDADKRVDVIVLLDYDVTLLMATQYIETKNKKLIKLGARDISEEMVNKKASTFACNTNDHRCLHGGSKPPETYCLTDLNITNKNRDELIIRNPVPPAIRAVIKSLKWKRIFLFYESAEEHELTPLVDGLSRDGVLFAMYNTDDVKDLLGVLKSIYKLKAEAMKEIHFVIVCRVTNTIRILKAANRFDSLNNEKTVLKMFSRWLIALHDYNYVTAKQLRDCAKDLDNVAVIALPEHRNIYIKDIHDSVESAALDILRGKLDGRLQGDCKEDFIKRFEKNAHSLNPTNLCEGYYIDTLLWTDKGRQFSHVGHADINGKIVLNFDVFPNTRFGYNKRSFLVSTLEYSPFVIKREVNNSDIYEGFCMDLLKELSSKLNFTYTIVEPEDRKWGSVINRVNLTFNGLVGQLQREEVDIVASAISVQAERDPAMDFSYPYYYGYTTVLVRKPDIYATKWRTLVDPFKWEVLLTIGASLLVVTVLVFILEKNNPFYTKPEHAEQREENGGLHTWHSSFWYVFGALLCQGGVHLPESTAGRTLISCWWLTCIIIVGTYCGNLIAFLTVTKERPPFNTLQEMNDLKGTYKWGTIGGTVWESMFPNSSNPTFRKMGRAFIEFNKSDPTILHGKPGFHVERVKKGKYAWIGDKTYMEIAMATECSLMTIKEEFMPLIYVLGFKNNSSHAAIFSEQIIKIHEGGLLQIWKRKWWPKSSFCAGSSITEAKPISLMDVQSAFYVCFIGVFFGGFAFLVEKLVHKYRTVLYK